MRTINVREKTGFALYKILCQNNNMTEHVKKIIGQVERLSESEQSELVDAILSLKKKTGRKSILDFVGIWNGGKALYSRLDRDSIYEK